VCLPYDPVVFRVLAACLAALLGLSLAPAAVADGGTPPLRILLTGDSITHGRHGDYTWRYRLAKEFQRQGVAVDFVGSDSSPLVDPGFATASYADPHFDHNHFAKSGWQLREMVFRIGDEVMAQRPDVIVLEAGINDFRYHPDDPNVVAETETALRKWIANVRTAKPDIRILLSPVLSADTLGAARLNGLAKQYNAALASDAVALSTPDSPITVATTDQGWNPAGNMTADGMHPSPTGETFIAQRIAEAMRRVGLLPGKPAIFRTLAWMRTLRPVVKTAGSRATVSWSTQAISGARIRLHRLGHAARTSKALASRGRATFTVARGATYEFRLQLVRSRMTGPWGPITRVHIPRRQPRPATPARATVNAQRVHWTASARATYYVVKIRKLHHKRWTTRHTTTTTLAVTKVGAAKVRAVNASGHSAWRRANR
jgi:lysophospholipase L1-like esterase